MGVREKFEERIKRKLQEITELEMKIGEARAYIQAMQEAGKLLPRESNGHSAESVLKPGSAAYRAMQVLREAGHPLHITEILKASGGPVTKERKILVGGTLSRYARVGQIFAKTAPNTFTLIGRGVDAEPPEDFGKDNEFDAGGDDDM